MSQTFIKHPLLMTLGLSWLAFAIAGFLIHLIFPIPELTVLIDRSYCPLNQWSQVAQDYTEIYRKYQRRQIDLQAVVLFSSLGEEVFSTPPNPNMIQTLSTYGRAASQREKNLQERYSKTQVLGCHAKR